MVRCIAAGLLREAGGDWAPAVSITPIASLALEEGAASVTTVAAGSRAA